MRMMKDERLFFIRSSNELIIQCGDYLTYFCTLKMFVISCNHPILWAVFSSQRKWNSVSVCIIFTGQPIDVTDRKTIARLAARFPLSWTNVNIYIFETECEQYSFGVKSIWFVIIHLFAFFRVKRISLNCAPTREKKNITERAQIYAKYLKKFILNLSRLLIFN